MPELVNRVIYLGVLELNCAPCIDLRGPNVVITVLTLQGCPVNYVLCTYNLATTCPASSYCTYAAIPESPDLVESIQVLDVSTGSPGMLETLDSYANPWRCKPPLPPQGNGRF